LLEGRGEGKGRKRKVGPWVGGGPAGSKRIALSAGENQSCAIECPPILSSSLMKVFQATVLNDRFIMLIILVNAMTIFVGGFPGLSDALAIGLERIDHACTLIFVIEALGKIRFWGSRAYFSDRWNVFDFGLIAVAVPSLFMAMGIPLGIQLEFLLVFRVLRVFKFFRFIRFIPNVENLILGVLRALRASVLIVLAFVVCNFIVALLSFSLFRNIAPEYFENPLLAFYTTFKLFTIEGWYEVPDALSEQLNPIPAFFTRLYFVVLLFGGGIFGLSLINSIFVESMLEDETQGAEKDRDAIRAELAELKAILLEDRERR